VPLTPAPRPRRPGGRCGWPLRRAAAGGAAEHRQRVAIVPLAKVGEDVEVLVGVALLVPGVPADVGELAARPRDHQHRRRLEVVVAVQRVGGDDPHPVAVLHQRRVSLAGAPLVVDDEHHLVQVGGPAARREMADDLPRARTGAIHHVHHAPLAVAAPRPIEDAVHLAAQLRVARGGHRQRDQVLDEQQPPERDPADEPEPEQDQEESAHAGTHFHRLDHLGRLLTRTEAASEFLRGARDQSSCFHCA
jgi:hypothetical protein